MKNMTMPIVLLAALCQGVVFAADGEVVRLSEPVLVTETHEIFGPRRH